MHSDNHPADFTRSRRTPRAHPEGTAPSATRLHHRDRLPLQVGRRALLQLVGLGLLLELLYLTLYPLLAGGMSDHDPVRQALPDLFPWLLKLYWTTLWPALPRLLAHVSWLNLGNSVGQANLSLLILSLASILMLFAVRIGNRVVREQLSYSEIHSIFRITLLLTALFGVTMLLLPAAKGAMSQDMLLYGLYGRMVTTHHVNPYSVAPTTIPQDMLQMILGAHSTAPYGPVWTDLSILVTLLAHDSVANILLGFRLIGLIAHLSNAILIWVILAKLKPEKRLAATLLYAWNPIILLLSIAQMHYEVVLTLLVLLAVLFFLRNSLILGWVLIVLAALVNPLALLLLPLFLRMIMKQIHFLHLGWRILWWPALTVISVSAATLAYMPYWQQGGSIGILTSLSQTFWQQSAINSVDAAIINLPIQATVWQITPHQWSLIALIIVGNLSAFQYLVGRYIGTHLTYGELAIAPANSFTTCLLALGNHPAADPGTLRQQPHNNIPGSIAHIRCAAQLLLLAQAACMGRTGTDDSGITTSDMGMDTFHLFDTTGIHKRSNGPI